MQIEFLAAWNKSKKKLVNDEVEKTIIVQRLLYKDNTKSIVQGVHTSQYVLPQFSIKMILGTLHVHGWLVMT